MRASFEIEGRTIGPTAPVFVIAEIGINHEGDEGLARELVIAAADARADAVKFQTVDAAESYLPGTASFAEFSGRALGRAAYERLNALARSRGVIPFSTPGDLSSLELMLASGMQAVKISSGQMTNTMLLRAAARTGLPLIISTGMADLAGVHRAVATVAQQGAGAIALLHCTSLYPAPAATLHLAAMGVLASSFGCPIGFSDHHTGTTAVLAAVARGARVIEKHFTLDSKRRGADHHLSIEPHEMARMMREIRLIESMIGAPEKAPVEEEARLAPERWRYLVARRAIAANETIEVGMLAAKRVPPGTRGIRALDVDDVTGQRTRRAIAADAAVQPEDLEPST